jgi:uncharacterized protein (TIGR01777 family)
LVILIVKIIQKIEVLTNSILITGASGLIGRRLTEVLLQKGCRVSHLCRKKQNPAVPTHLWNPDEGYLDADALDGVDTVINLAGAGLADKRWTGPRKEEIIASRVKSTALLANALRTSRHNVKTVIQASAVGYYGPGKDSHLFKEEDAPGSDFLAGIVQKWEQAADGFESPGLRLVKFRFGIVLSEKGGALRELVWPVRWGVGAPLGTGRQIMSWIHIDDLCELFAWAAEDESVKGTFNAVAPEPVTNHAFNLALGQQLRRPLWLPPIPGVVLRLLLGEMAVMVIKGSNVSCEKVIRQGFEFRFPRLHEALCDLLPR